MHCSTARHWVIHRALSQGSLECRIRFEISVLTLGSLTMVSIEDRMVDLMARLHYRLHQVKLQLERIERTQLVMGGQIETSRGSSTRSALRTTMSREHGLTWSLAARQQRIPPSHLRRDLRNLT